MEIYTEIKIFTGPDYGYSVEDYHKDVGGDGITIESFDYISGQKQNCLRVCMDKKSAIEVAKAILKICDKNKPSKYGVEDVSDLDDLNLDED